jgi:Spy/CpxP family protein refolding chaperone
MKTKLKSILLIALVFLAGIVVGATAAGAKIKKVVAHVMAHPDAVRAKIERDLTRDLKLRADQRQRVHDITVAGMKELDTLRQEFHPRFTNVIGKSEQEIRAVLDDEQKGKFDEILRKRSLKKGAAKTP